MCFLCRCCVFVSAVHQIAILSVVFCVICSLLKFVSDAIGDHMVQTYSSMGLVMALYVARIVSFCFHHVVDVSALSICIVLCAFVLVISIYVFVVCEFGVEIQSYYFLVDIHGECDVVSL